MNRIGLEAKRLRTASTTSTTGPQVRLVQNFGVAKVTTKRRCAAREPAIESRSSARSGGVAVVSAETGAVASVGVGEAGAFAPTGGSGRRAFTSKTLTALIVTHDGTTS